MSDRMTYNESLARAEAATDLLRPVSPLIAEAIRAWAEVVLNLSGHDLNGMRGVVLSEQALNAERDGQMKAVIGRLDQIAVRLDRGDQRFDQIDAALERLRPTAFMSDRPTTTPGTCARCGAELNNVSPGYSILSGGAQVCAGCIGPNDREALRARGLAVD